VVLAQLFELLGDLHLEFGKRLQRGMVLVDLGAQVGQVVYPMAQLNQCISFGAEENSANLLDSCLFGGRAHGRIRTCHEDVAPAVLQLMSEARAGRAELPPRWLHFGY